MDQPTEHIYVDLTSTNERLMAEMNQFLESIKTTKTTDSSSKSKNNDSKSEKKSSTLSTPSAPIVSVPPSPEKCDAAIKKAPRNSSSNVNGNANKNLNPIDEVNPSEYEYYSDVTANTTCKINGTVQVMESDANSVFDDDSLLAMAQRMDDSASIISDITTPSFRTRAPSATAAKPTTKMITASMKKLGQKLNSTKKLSSPTNSSRNTAPPPRKSQPSRNYPHQQKQQQQQQKLNNHQLMIAQGVGGLLPSGMAANMTTTSTTSSKLKCDQSTTSTSSSSPSSSKETIDIRLASNSDKQCGELNTAKKSSSEQVNKNKGADVQQQQLSPGMRAINNAYIQQWGGSSLPSQAKNTTTSSPNHESKPPARRRRSPKKKNKHRSPRTTNDAAATLPAKYQGGGHNDSEMTLDKMPGASAYLARGNATPGKPTTKKSKESSKSRHRRKMGHNKKRQQKKGNKDDSDDEPMTGIGFNTRIHVTPVTVIQQQAQDDDNNNNNNIDDRSNEELLMKGAEDTPRAIHPNPQIETNSKRSADRIMQEAIEKSRARRLAKPPPSRTDIQEQHYESSGKSNNGDYTDSESNDDTYTSSNAENDNDYTSSNSENENDDSSAYDSDDQTQIFYESDEDYYSDDHDYDSEEEEQRVAAVGMSVADAVKGLNDKRAVTKVKNLFGIRK